MLGRTVALKTLVHSFGAPTEQKQFLREAQIVSQLSHPAIVNLYDVGVEDGNVAYLVMEYVAGKTLQQVLAESTGPMPIPRACAWISDLAGALHRAHRSGVIHGDIKPANILVTEDGKVKLSDFGIARFATQVSGSGKMMGTPAYLSPEQILGEPQNTRSDLFSLGIVLYQMVTGVAPFDGSSVSAVCAQILQAEPVPPSQRNPAVPRSWIGLFCGAWQRLRRIGIRRQKRLRRRWMHLCGMAETQAGQRERGRRGGWCDGWRDGFRSNSAIRGEWSAAKEWLDVAAVAAGRCVVRERDWRQYCCAACR